METIGIIGGGQLAYFLAEAAITLGIRPVVLAKKNEVVEKCAGATILHGSDRDRLCLADFFSRVKTVIFENEWIDTALLEKIADGKIDFYPALSLMERLQNKLHQKEDLVRLGIPSPEYIVVNKRDDLEADIAAIENRFAGNFVLKWSRNGYDGKGVFLARASQYVQADVISFCTQAFDAASNVYAEPLVNFSKEVSLVAIRSRNGDFKHYPLVITEQSQGTCRYVLGKALNMGVSADVENKASDYARKLSAELNLTGTFAIEFFLTGDNVLLVNEIAPRVHNSGHFTLDASSISQFENHIRAVLGMELLEIKTKPFFAMLNLLGPEGIAIDNLNAYAPTSTPNVYMHWYGKNALRPKRKMGHMNVFAENAEQYSGILNELEEVDKKWKLEMEKMYEK